MPINITISLLISINLNKTEVN